jgi:putative membrane protein
MWFIGNLIVVSLAAWILPGIQIDGLIAVILVTITLAIINTYVSPLIVVLTLPITFLTLGLFLLVIDVITIYIANWILPGFHVAGFWSAFFFGFIISAFGSILN